MRQDIYVFLYRLSLAEDGLLDVVALLENVTDHNTESLKS
jgi:hypothetical protein